MRALIVEDETAAARNLKGILEERHPEIDIIATLESVAECVEWFGENSSPDLVFMDIHLADGNAFRIFDKITIEAPIIFTTAYDEYALEAFKVNSIDYILKPIKQEELDRAIVKFTNLTAPQRAEISRNITTMAERARSKTQLIRIKDRLIPVAEEDIAYFFTSNEQTSLTTFDGKEYPVDGTLESLNAQYGGSNFFRANRQFIIARKAIKDISVWFGSRLALNLVVDTPERIIISKARVPEFKGWLQ